MHPTYFTSLNSSLIYDIFIIDYLVNYYYADSTFIQFNKDSNFSLTELELYEIN